MGGARAGPDHSDQHKNTAMHLLSNSQAIRPSANLQNMHAMGQQANNQMGVMYQNMHPNAYGMPQAQPNDSNALMSFQNYARMAEYYGSKGDYISAIQYYLKMTEIDPENGPSWAAIGHCYLLSDDINKAFNAYQQALYCLEDIRDPQLWYGIGILYEKFESYDHAISALIAVLKMAPNF